MFSKGQNGRRPEGRLNTLISSLPWPHQSVRVELFWKDITMQVKFGTWEAARLVVPEKAKPQTAGRKAVRYMAEPPNGSGMSGTDTSGGRMEKILKIGVLFDGLVRSRVPAPRLQSNFLPFPYPAENWKFILQGRWKHFRIQRARQAPSIMNEERPRMKRRPQELPGRENRNSKLDSEN